jgi:sortase (surface protein transpeptidase)
MSVDYEAASGREVTLHRPTSILVLAALVLLAVAALALASPSGSGRADLVGPARLIADRPGELASRSGSTVRDAADPGPSTPLPLVPNGPGPVQTAPPDPDGSAVKATTRADASDPAPSFLRSLEAAAPAVPLVLSIPSLAVESRIVPVGLEDDGTMQIPGADEAGWYLPGRLPGAATGSAVIAAHVDYEGSPGVFIDLRRIEIGSEVEVTDAEGTVHRFTVAERYQVEKDYLPVEELFRTGGEPILTLVTCGGAFDPNDRSYSDNIVVRALPSPT